MKLENAIFNLECKKKIKHFAVVLQILLEILYDLPSVKETCYSHLKVDKIQVILKIT